MDLRQIIMTAALLAGFTAMGVGLVALTQQGTEERIAANEKAIMLARVSAVLTPGSYDNDPIADHFDLTAPDELGLRLGLRTEAQAEAAHGFQGYRARLANQVTAVVLPVVAREGYSGDINLLVGVDAEGHITGVRVTRHRETPGLGDLIEASKSDWILGFEGKSLDNPKNGWAVRKDGGEFDQFTGATITPRAVVRAVYNALQYAQRHHAELFETEQLKEVADE